MNSILERINGAGYAFVEFALAMLVQSCVLILILLVADLLLRKKVRAVFRYWIWMLVLLKLILPTSLSSPFSLGSLVGEELASVEVAATVPQSKAEELLPAPVNVPPVIAHANTESVTISTERVEPPAAVMPETENKMAVPSRTPVVRPMPPTPPIPTIQPARLSWQAVVFLVWLAVVAVMGLLLLQRAFFVRKLVMQAGQADGPLTETFASCRKLLAIRGKVGLKVSGNANSPAICGLFRPVILVPRNLEQGLDTGQLKAVLLHELAHIRRGDLWVNLAQTLLQIFYVYNPLLWLANGIIRRIREQAVDETVLVAMGQKAQQYPQTLVHVAKMAFNRPAAGLRLIGVVESKSALAGRIRHILSRPIPKTAKLGVLSLTAIIVTAALLLPMAKSDAFGGWFAKKSLIEFSSNDEPTGVWKKSGDTTTYSKNYTVEFAKGEKLAIVAELYQVGKPMRNLGCKIFSGSGQPQKLSVVLKKNYRNEEKTSVGHDLKVSLGDQDFNLNDILVTTPEVFNNTSRSFFNGSEIAKKSDDRPYVEFDNLLRVRACPNGGKPRAPRIWMPTFNNVTWIDSDAYFISVNMLALSQLDNLNVDVPHYAEKMQLPDGTYISGDSTKEQRDAVADGYLLGVRQALFREQVPLPKLTAHKYYKAGEPVHVRVACKGHGWKPTLEEIDYDGNIKPIFVLIDGKEYECHPVFGPFSGISMNLQLPQTEGSSLPPGRHTVAYGWRDLDVVDPEKPGRVIHYDKLVTDVVEFEVVDEMPDGYYRDVYEDGWEEILRRGIQTPFTDNMRQYGVSGPLFALRIDSLPFDIAFDIYAQAKGDEEREYAGRVARQANSGGPYIMGCDRQVEQLNWDTVGQKQWRLILVPSEQVAAANPPVHHYYGKEFVTDWATFEKSERFEQNRMRHIAYEQGGELPDSANTGEPAVLRVAAEGGAMYRSIQEAIDAAGAGAVIHVGPGVYREHLKIDKPLTLLGSSWKQTTVITTGIGADVLEQTKRMLQARMQEAETDEQRSEIAEKFKAEFKEKYGGPTLLVSDAEGVVIRNLKLTSPGRPTDGGMISIPILEFNNARASVSRCAVIGAPGDGIHVLNGSNVEIRRTLVAAVWGTGIIVGERQGPASSLLLLDSELRNCRYAGICIRKGCDSTTVERCRISGAAWHGIRYDDCSPAIVGNRIFGNARCGIYASGKTAASVRQNVFYANEMVGMSCWFQNRDIIEGNSFAGNKEAGLSILGASEPVLQKNIFFSESDAVVCGDIGDDSAFAVSDGIVSVRNNLFWNNNRKLVRRLAKTNTTEEVTIEKQAGNIETDPMFVNAEREDFSLKDDSPARLSGIGVARPIGFESPWPLQPEEAAIIPDGKTRDYRKWKTPTQSAPPVEEKVQETAAIEVKDGLHIRAFIDGRDTIRIKGVELWYEHHAWDLPGKWWDRGRNIKHDEPTYINGTAWKPEWMEKISRPYRLGQTIPLRESGNLIRLTKIAGKGTVSITELPQQANDYTLSILLDDTRNDGAQWYELLIQWGPRDSQNPQQLPSPTPAGAPVSAAKSALQRMIDSAQPGGMVIIPKGVYTEPVIVAKPLTLKGQSRKDCIFEVTANRPAVFVDTGGKGKVIIEAVTVKWQLATSDRTEHPFAVGVKDTRAEVKNCCFKPLGDFKRCPVAINAMGFSELNIDTCRFEGFEYTVCFGQGTKGTIRNSLVMDSGHQGISLYSSATAEIVGNVVTGSKFHAVRSTGGTLNMTDNLIINNANRGVYLGNKSARGSITSNVIIGNGTGISGFAQSNVKIENNIIADSSYAGIGMRDSCSLSIRDNIFKGNERGWIMFKELGRNNNSVYRNTFWRNKADTENLDKTADSIVADPAFADPDNGDFSLKPGPALEQRQGLKNPQVLKLFWKRWESRANENDLFAGARGLIGPLVVRFVGVRPDNGDDILDATGKKTGPAGLSVRGGNTWAAHCLRRDFIFELPATEAPILFFNRRLVRPSRQNVELCSGQVNPLYPERVSGRTYVVLDTRIPRQYRRSYLGLINSRRDTGKVDVTLQYFCGPPAKTLFRFTGPFELGQTVSADNKTTYSLEITEDDGSGVYAGPGLTFRLTAPERIGSGTPILIYDDSGNRHLTWVDVFRTDSKGTTIDFRPLLSPIPLSGIKAIVAEEPRQYTVRNVLVDYPDRPPRSHAEYLDTMAERLGLAGLSQEQLAQYQFRNPQQAIEVIDIVRGDRHIRNAVEAIRYGKPKIDLSELDAQTQEKIRLSANQWAGWGYLSGYGIQLGLVGQWPEFFDMAIERLGGGYLSYQDYPGYERAMLNADYDIAGAMTNHMRELTPDQVRQLKELISRTADGVVLKFLFTCLARTQSQAVINASWELAQDDRPWIWWQAIQIWHGQTHTSSRSYDNLSDTIKLRLVLARGVPDDEQLRARANSMLPDMFTPELARMASGIWSDVRLKLAQNFDRKTATEVYIGFLRRMQEDMTAQRWAGNDIYKNRSKWMVAYLIRTLNVWYDVNIGNQGTDETDDSRKNEPKTLTEFNQLIAEALQWYDSQGNLKPAELVFAGRVVDTAGKGIADAMLTLTKLENIIDENGYERQQRAEVGTFRADADGSFAFVPPPDKKSFDLTVTAPGFITRNPPGFQRLPDGRYRLNDGNIIEMQRPGRITGRIISEDGEALADARLRLSCGDRYSRPLVEREELKTDAQGRFVLDNISSGYHVLSYHKPKLIRVGRNSHSQYGGICAANVLHLDEGRSLENVLLDLTKSNCSLEIEVVDSKDNPVTAATIWLQAKIPAGRYKFADIFTVYNTNEHGLYRFENLPPIEGYVLVYSDELNFSSKVEVKLIPQETVRCRIKYKNKVVP